MTATIGREELKVKIDSGGDVVLVETLDPEYCEDAHLPGASTCHSIGSTVTTDDQVRPLLSRAVLCLQLSPDDAASAVADQVVNAYPAFEGERRIPVRLLDHPLQEDRLGDDTHGPLSELLDRLGYDE